MSWVLLVTAVLLDVAATVALKYSDGMTRIGPTALAFALFGLSVVGVGLALRELPLTSVYLVWLGLGVGLMAVLGGLLYQEVFTVSQWLSVGAIAVGVVGLAVSDTRQHQRPPGPRDSADVTSWVSRAVPRATITIGERDQQESRMGYENGA